MCRCSRKRRISPSDGRDNAWAIREPVIPAATREGQPHDRERRDSVNSMFSVLRSRCPRRIVPQNVPTWRTVSLSFREWKQAGGSRSMQPCDERCVSALGVIRNHARPCSTVHPLKPAPFAAMHAGIMGGNTSRAEKGTC